MSVLLPEYLSGQPVVLFNKKLSKTARENIEAKWKADSINMQQFLDAYAESCSRIKPDSLSEAKHYDTESLYRRYAKNGFAACAGDLYFYYQDLMQRMSAEEQQAAISAMENAAKHYKSKTLASEAEWMRILLLPVNIKEQAAYKLKLQYNFTGKQVFSDEFHFRLRAMEEQTANKLKLLNEFIDKQISGKEVHFRLRAMRELFNLNRDIFTYNLSILSPGRENPTNVIRQAFSLYRELENATIETYPLANSDYVAIGEVFYLFDDSARLIPILEKVLAQPVTSFPDPSRLQAGIMMGRYMRSQGYRQQAKDFFLGVLESEDIVTDRLLYNAMALANWGICSAESVYPDAVLPLLETSLPPLKERQKDELTYEVYRTLSTIYIKIDNREKAVAMRDSFRHYVHDGEIPDPLFWYDDGKYRLKYIHYTEGAISYYNAVAELLEVGVRYQSYDPVNITNVVAEIYEKEATLEAMKLASLRNRHYTVLIMAILSLSAFLTISRLYRKKQSAYRILAEKAGQWAKTDTLEVITSDTGSGSQEKCEEAGENAPEINPEDKRLMNHVHDAMTKDQLYKDNTLSLDSLADKMNVHRHMLSHAINSITGKNFNRFVNEYRIKEAIRILTSSSRKKIYIDELHEQVGFSSRTSFYRVFKQITGISPNEYKNNGFSENKE
jgi:AraC-like DNA-binding protein